MLVTKKLIIGVALVLSTLNLFAQEIRLAGVEYINYPKVQLKDDASGFEVSFQEFGAFVAFPKVLKNKKTILINGLSYGFVKSEAYNPITGTENSQDFHRIIYSISAIHRLNEQWTLTSRLAPTMATDFGEALSWDDFLLQGALLATKKLSEQARIGGGIIYTTRLGRPLLLPGFQYLYKKDKHAIQVFFPAIINYAYTIDAEEKLKAGFRIGINGSNFNASVDNNTNLDVDRLNYLRVNMGPELIYRLTETLQFEASGGISAKRMYKFEDTQGEVYDYDSKSGAFFNVGLILVPPRKNKQK